MYGSQCAAFSVSNPGLQSIRSALDRNSSDRRHMEHRQTLVSRNSVPKITYQNSWHASKKFEGLKEMLGQNFREHVFATYNRETSIPKIRSHEKRTVSFRDRVFFWDKGC